MVSITSALSQLLGAHGSPIPASGFKCTSPITLAAGLLTSINLGTTQNHNSQFLESLQAIYVDNGGNASALTFTFASGQSITWPADTQGYVNVLQPNPINFTVNNPGSTATVMLINAQMSNPQWVAASL